MRMVRELLQKARNTFRVQEIFYRLGEKDKVLWINTSAMVFRDILNTLRTKRTWIFKDLLKMFFFNKQNTYSISKPEWTLLSVVIFIKGFQNIVHIHKFYKSFSRSTEYHKNLSSSRKTIESIFYSFISNFIRYLHCMYSCPSETSKETTHNLFYRIF